MEAHNQRTLLCQYVGVNSIMIKRCFHDSQMAKDSASLLLLATIRTLGRPNHLQSNVFMLLWLICHCKHILLNKLHTLPLAEMWVHTSTHRVDNKLCFWHVEQSSFVLSLVHNQQLLLPCEKHPRTALKPYSSISLYKVLVYLLPV